MSIPFPHLRYARILTIPHDRHQDTDIVLFPAHEIQPFLDRTTHERTRAPGLLGRFLSGFTECIGQGGWLWRRRMGGDDIEDIFIELSRGTTWTG